MVSKEFIEGYISGLIDGEASFSVSIKLQRDLRCKVRLDPVFSITQEDRKVLELVQGYIKCGRIIKKPGQEHLWILIVDNLDELRYKLIPFIERNTLLIAKRKQFRIFKEIVTMLAERKYKLGCNDIKKLVVKAYELSNLSRKSRRRRSLSEILTLIPSGGGEAPGER